MSVDERPVAAVFLTALFEEAEAVLVQIADVRSVESRFRRYFEGQVDDRRVIVWPVEQMGNAAAGIAARSAIALLNPALLVLTGIAGGVEAADRALGDVIVPEQIVYYEAAKVRPDGVVPRWEVFRPTLDFRTAARIAARSAWWREIPVTRPDGSDEQPRVHFGVLASGEKVIADRVRMDDLTAVWSKAVGVEMESVGAALGVYESEERPAFGVVKAISDWADATKNDDWRAYAASAAARLAIEVVRVMGPPEPRPQPQVADSALSTHAPTALKAGWGRKKIELCQRMTQQEAFTLADWFDVPPHDRDQFGQQGPCQAVWEWLQRRARLSELADALISPALNRPDLAEIAESVE
jgi:nucleoside phosphorylase